MIYLETKCYFLKKYKEMTIRDVMRFDMLAICWAFNNLKGIRAKLSGQVIECITAYQKGQPFSI